ncbi:MAG: hypothetical protein HY076_05425, partial [Candidatus Eisenbacteria bacterium]|nr:hypothetical protein [Candidatus Eisenbacteria bacterium]
LRRFEREVAESPRRPNVRGPSARGPNVRGPNVRGVINRFRALLFPDPRRRA